MAAIVSVTNAAVMTVNSGSGVICGRTDDTPGRIGCNGCNRCNRCNGCDGCNGCVGMVGFAMEVSMIRSLLFAISLLMVVTSVATRGAETFGAAPTVKDATPIAQLLDKPDDFQGKTVRVEGIVTDVC